MNRLLSLFVVCACQLVFITQAGWASGGLLGRICNPALQQVQEEETKFTLTLNTVPANAGSFNRSSGGTFSAGQSVYMNSYANTDYVFEYWQSDGEIVSRDRSFYFTMPDHDATLTAVFRFDPGNPGNPDAPGQTKKYTLTLNTQPANAGSFNRSSGEQFAAGQSVSMRAYTNTDYTFSHWTSADTVVSNSSSFNFIMPEHDAALTAVYNYSPGNPADPDTAQVYYTVTLKTQPANAGSFNWNDNTQRVAGSSGYVYAYANSDYVFREWQLDGQQVSTSQRYDFTMPAKNMTLVAVYDYSPGNPGNPGKNYWNAETGEVIVDDFSAGSLSSALSNTIDGSSNRDKVQMITVAGTVSQSDWGVVNNYKNCTLLDMSRTYGMTYVPSYNFSGNSVLTTVVLPASIEKIDYYAFHNCSSLSSISIYAPTPPEIGSRAFEGIADSIVYVPADAISLYQDAEGWKDFTILPLAKEVSALEVNLPEGTDVNVYKDMFIELVNAKSGQKQRYVVTNRLTYTFNSLIHRTSYNLYLKNQQGDVLGQVDGIDIIDQDVSVTFPSLMVPRDLTLRVLTPSGEDVTSQATITWFDQKDTYLTRGSTLTGQLEGVKVKYRVQLPQTLAMLYQLPADVTYEVQATNTISLTLADIPQTTISGVVRDVKTGQALSGATVAVSQMLNGLYSKSFTTKTDSKGQWSLQVYEAKTDVTASMDDYVSQTQSFDTPVAEVPAFELKDISGTTIALALTYTSTGGETQEFYSDYTNVAYTVFNETTGRQVTEMNVQYPQIVLMEQLPAGTVLRVTATSKNQKFVPVTATATVDSLDRASATLAIKQLGGIAASFRQTDNPSVTAILYNANGQLLKKYDYASASLTISELQDGQYTLVSMANSQFFNSIGSIGQFAEAGLREGIDYVKNTVTVRSGEMAVVENALIPFLDESKLYYTGDGTSITVNKSQITTGNYLTITGKIDFKPAYANSVSDVKLIVNLPEEASFVENSVMRGSITASYTYADNQVVVPLDYYGERVRFCFIPTAGGDFTATAQVQFTMKGKTVTQPIGNAKYTVKDLSINLPSTVANTTMFVSGAAPGKSSVEIYDDGMLIGSTTSLANGTWSTTCELDEPYNLSTHNIYAKVTTNAGMELVSETKQVVFDKNMVMAEKVTMLYYNPEYVGQYNIVFDLINGTVSPKSYYFFPYKSYPNWWGSGTEPKDFTFIADLSNNDSTAVNGVTIRVYTDNGYWRNLEAQYNTSMNRWVVVSQFVEEEAPVGVDVEIDSQTKILVDRKPYDDVVENYEIAKNKGIELEKTLSKWNEEVATIEQNGISEQEEIKSIIESLDSGTMSDEEEAEAIKQLCSIAGYELSDDALIADDLDLNDEELDAFVQNLLSECDSIVNNHDGSFDVYELELEKKLEEAESFILENVILDTDSITSINSDTIYVQSGDTLICLKRVSLEEFTIPKVDSGQIITLPLTDGNTVTIYYDDIQTSIVDSLNNCVWIVDGVSPDELLLSDNILVRKSPRRALGIDGIVANLQKAQNTLTTAAKDITTWIYSIKSELNNEIGKLEKFIEDLQKELSDLSKQSSAKAEQLAKVKKKLKLVKKYGKNVNQNTLKKTISSLEAECASIENEIQRINKLKNNANSLIVKHKAAIAVNKELLGQIVDIASLINDIWKLVEYIGKGINDCYKWNSFVNSILPCENDYQNAHTLKYSAEDAMWAYAGEYSKASGLAFINALLQGMATFDPRVKKLTKNVFVNYALQVLKDFIGNNAKSIFDNALNASKQKYSYYTGVKKKLKCNKDDKCPRCGKNPCECKDKCPRCGNRPCTCPDKCPKCGQNPCVCPRPDNTTHVQHDPSGYVYEGVASNRLQGVMASCYYKETVEDMYGDLHENVVLWDAEEYAQKNPLFTDEYGMYRWDVPKGLWQVKFEKEGYQTTYSEWLPVPPPQLEVNIAMTQLLQPSVATAKAYDEGIEVTFDKYMNPESLNTDNIFVTRNGEKAEGTIELLNEEVAYEGQSQTFASKMRFTMPEGEELLSTDEVQLTVRKAVESYAGVQMQNDYVQTFDVEPRVRTLAIDSLVNIGYGNERTLTVAALPVDASKGKKVTVKSLSSMIASVETEELTLDENGQAELKVTGELPGSTVLSYQVEGTDVEGVTTVNVKDAAMLVTVAPRASRVSGTEVYRGTEIRLTSETQGAEIWYTLDGSCPCNTETALKYNPDEPIIIAGDSVTIKAMAQGHDLAESDVAEFSYTLKKTTLGYQLPAGWTWISHNVESPVAAQAFQEGAERIVSQTQEVISDPQAGFIGTLHELQPATAYKVKQKAQNSVRLTGYEWNAGQNSVVVEAGWNWIGYPVNQTMTVQEALNFFSPSEGDYIVGQNGYCEYANGAWHGTLETMTPGEGYMYKSAVHNEILFNTAVRSVTASRRSKRMVLNDSPWAANSHAYPNVMPLTAHVYANGVCATAGDYVVAAFAGSECRGVGQWQDNRLLMSIGGEGGEKLHFMAFDPQTGQVYNVAETLTFEADNVGNWNLPFALIIGSGTVGIGNLYADLTVTPKVARDHVTVSAKGHRLGNVTLTDMSGRVVAAATGRGSEDATIATSQLPAGVYIVTAVADGQSYYQKIVKKSK